MTGRRPLYVFGAGGHGKVVAEAALASGRFSLLGFLDDNTARHGQALLGLPVEGSLTAVGGRRKELAIALGVGANSPRLMLLARLSAAGHVTATIVHPSAVVVPSATLEEGCFVAPLAAVHTDARLGRACIINSGAVVEHDCQLGNGVHVSPNATLGGNVILGDEVHVGLGAVVLPGITVGARSVVGAGAVVTEDVPTDVTVVGVPARRLLVRDHVPG